MAEKKLKHPKMRYRFIPSQGDVSRVPREGGIMLSACLAGVPCVYDGSHKAHPVFEEMARKGAAVLFCPEVLGGLKVPHPPSEIAGGDGGVVLRGRARVVSRDGCDVTVFFVRGAKKALAMAKKNEVKKAVMKARSPSCGCGRIYDGTFSRVLVDGDGVTAALFKENGIEVVSDEEYLRLETKSHRKTQNEKRKMKTKNSKRF
jgi:uncharacterized protein YbbK (DUF523 family)